MTDARHAPSTGARTRFPAAALAAGLLAAAAAGAAPPAPEAASLVARLGLEEAAGPVSERPGWRRPQKVLVPAIDDPARLAWLQQAAPGVELVPVDSLAAAVAAAPRADAVIGFCHADVLAAGPDIAWVQILSAGAERCVSVPAVRERGILLTNMQRVAGPVMSEHVIAMMFALGRKLPAFLAAQPEGRWDRGLAEEGMWTMEGKTVLVVGLGGIGTEVARRAQALGMTVIAIRNSRREGPPFVARVGLPGELLEFAREADFVINTAPLTEATRGMFDAAFFGAMRRGAHFVNVGRGRSVVTDALVSALRSGQVGGAGLDVTDPEPLPPEHPLWRLPNVIITPHVSARSDLGNDARWAVARENLRRYAAGERMLSVVDVERGY
jgi:phosphoglycerate dehydrogenase-like enzyme